MVNDRRITMNFIKEEEKIQIDTNGEMTEYSVLFRFHSKDTMKSYIGYTDHKIASNHRKNIYVSSYNPLSQYLELENITDDKELEMIQDVLQKLYQEANE